MNLVDDLESIFNKSFHEKITIPFFNFQCITNNNFS